MILFPFPVGAVAGTPPGLVRDFSIWMRIQGRRAGAMGCVRQPKTSGSVQGLARLTRRLRPSSFLIPSPRLPSFLSSALHIFPADELTGPEVQGAVHKRGHRLIRCFKASGKQPAIFSPTFFYLFESSVQEIRFGGAPPLGCCCRRGIMSRNARLLGVSSQFSGNVSQAGPIL